MPSDTNDPATPRLLEQSDPLLQPPDSTAPPISYPKIPNLNFQSLSWPDFQKLAVAIATTVEDHGEAHEYGSLGQKQHGIDVLAIDNHGAAHAYQARKVATFTESELRKAVQDFAGGSRPWSPIRFVIVVACQTDRTQLLDELAELRKAHSGDFEIDLYGEAKLSEILRDQPDIVERFFGVANAERFCVGIVQHAVAEPMQSAERRSALIADAVLRGPIKVLDLESQLADADGIADTDPACEFHATSASSSVNVEGGKRRVGGWVPWPRYAWPWHLTLNHGTQPSIDVHWSTRRDATLALACGRYRLVDRRMILRIV